jgi:hypothetical protein
MIEDFAIPYDVWEAALKVSNYAKQQGWGNEWCIADVSNRAMHDAYLEYKAEYNKLLNICTGIYYARIALRNDLVIDGLNKLDAYFREENMN